MIPTDDVDEVADAAEGGFSGRSLSASLTVSDLAASLAWYRDVAGFVVDRLHSARAGPSARPSRRATCGSY